MFTTASKIANGQLGVPSTPTAPTAPNEVNNLAPSQAPKPLETAGTDIDTSQKPKESLFKQAFTQENVVGSAIEREKYKMAMAMVPQVDPNFNAMEELKKPENIVYADYAEYTTDIVNRTQFNLFKQRVDGELQRKRALSGAGIKGTVALLGASAIDPINLVLSFATFGVGGLALDAGSTVAKRIALTAGAGALGGTVTTAVQEAGLQATQVSRTLEDSTANVLSAGVMGGILGGAVSSLMKPNRDAIRESIADIFKGKQKSIVVDAPVHSDKELMSLIGKAGSERQLNLDVSKSLHKVFKATKSKHIPDWLKTSFSNKFDNVDNMTREDILNSLSRISEETKSNKNPKWTNNFIDKVLKEIPDTKDTDEVKHYIKFTRDTLRQINDLNTPNDELRKIVSSKITGVPPKLKATLLKRLEVNFGGVRNDVVSSSGINRIIKKVEKHLKKLKSVDSGTRNTVTRNIEDELHRILIEEQVQPALNRVVAMRNKFETIDPNRTLSDLAKDEELKNIGGIQGMYNWVAKVFSLNSPVARGLLSDSVQVREFTDNVLDHNLRTNANTVYGKASPISVESLMKLDSAENFSIRKKSNGIFREYLGSTSNLDHAKKLILKPKGKLTREQFSHEIAVAMNEEDVHANPYVQKNAELYRKVLDKTGKKLKELGMLDKDASPKAAQSYYMQIWNRDLVIKERPKVLEMLANLFEAPKRDPKNFKTIEYISEDNVKSADRAIDNILGIGDGRLQFDTVARSAVSSGKFSKERVLDFKVSTLSKYLIQDADTAITTYLHKVSGVIRLQEWLNSKKFANLTEFKKSIREEAKHKQNLTASADERARLGKNLTKDLSYVDDMVSILTDDYRKHSYPSLDPYLRTLRKYNVVTKLGGVVIASMADLGSMVLTHGYPSIFEHGIKPLISNFKAYKLTADELSDYTLGLDFTQDELLKKLTETGEFAGRTTSKSGKIGNLIVSAFGHVTGMNAWNATFRRLSAVISTAKTLRTLKNLDSSPKLHIQRLSDIGITEDMGKRIIKEFDKHGRITNGSYIGSYAKWADEGAVQALMASTEKELDMTIISPSKGDIPIWANSELGKTLFQFRTFSAAASNKILLRGIQRYKEPNTLQGLVTMVALGALSVKAKDAIMGRKRERSFLGWVAEGMSSSGILGTLGDLMFSLNPYATSSRFAGMNAMNVFIGVSGSTIMNMFSVASDLAKNRKIDEATKKKIVSLIPYNNLFYLKAAINRNNK